MPDKAIYSIGACAKQTGLSIDTLRYYEKEGLLEPQRDTNGRRQYSDGDLRWCAFIKRIKATGMPLSTIKDYSDLRRQGDSTIDKRIGLLEQQRALLEARRQELDEHLEFLDAKVATYARIKKDLQSGS